MDDNNEKYWWLVTTKIRQEEKAEFNLNRQGYETYRPMAKRLKKRRGKMKTVIESLFPGYIFIQLDLVSDNWTPIRSTFGVSKIVGFGEKPAKVPNKLIDTLIKEHDLYAEKVIDLDRYKKGDAVRIDEEGPFYGRKGIFQNYDGQERIIVLLSILQSETKLSISPDDISPE